MIIHLLSRPINSVFEIPLGDVFLKGFNYFHLNFNIFGIFLSFISIILIIFYRIILTLKMGQYYTSNNHLKNKFTHRIWTWLEMLSRKGSLPWELFFGLARDHTLQATNPDLCGLYVSHVCLNNARLTMYLVL